MTSEPYSQNRSEELPGELQRYSRQIKFPEIGVEGQLNLQRSTALVVGCGALGSVIAEALVRAGVGRVRLVDRDFLELHNLQRQVLYDEEDVQRGIPKAIAAQQKLQRINSQVEIEGFVEDVNHTNVQRLSESADVIVDGTDNFEVRFLLNDLALDSNTPFIYGGCIGSEGQTMTIIPGKSACLHCLMIDGPPPPGTTPGCDVAGIVGPIVGVVASLEAIEAIKILSGRIQACRPELTVVDVWSGRMTKMKVDNLPEKVNCPACRQGQRRWLSGEASTRTAVLCGRNAVQIRGQTNQVVDLNQLEERLKTQGNVVRNEYLLKFEVDEFTLTVFPNGRAIILGTGEPAMARSLYARWIGS